MKGHLWVFNWCAELSLTQCQLQTVILASENYKWLQIDMIYSIRQINLQEWDFFLMNRVVLVLTWHLNRLPSL